MWLIQEFSAHNTVEVLTLLINSFQEELQPSNVGKKYKTASSNEHAHVDYHDHKSVVHVESHNDASI